MKTTYEIDPAHSSIQFAVRHMMVSNVRGGFSGVKGTITFDPDDLAASSIRANIDVSTINTLDAKRDEHLKGADFLDVTNYPEMTFVSRQIEPIGDGEYRVTGDFTLHGTTKPVVLTIGEIPAEAKDPWGNFRIGAVAKGKISRKEFGLEWNAALETGGVLVGDDIKIELDIEAIKQQAAQTQSGS